MKRSWNWAVWTGTSLVFLGGVSDETKLELGSVDRHVAGFPRRG
jgi:hypothetical protein